MKIKLFILTLIAVALLFIPVAQAQMSSANVNVSPIYKPVYTVSGVAVTLASAATDAVLLQGSATKSIQIKKVTVYGLCTSAAGTMDVSLVKRTTLDTNNASCTASLVPFACCTGSTTGTCAGVHTAPAITAYDSNDPTATAVAWQFSTNSGTVGTGTVLEDRMLNFGLVGATGTVEFSFANKNDKPPRLRNTSEWLAINFNGQTVPTSGAISYTIEFEEF